VIAGRFRLEHEVKCGGMGRIFRAVAQDGSAMVSVPSLALAALARAELAAGQPEAALHHAGRWHELIGHMVEARIEGSVVMRVRAEALGTAEAARQAYTRAARIATSLDDATREHYWVPANAWVARVFSNI
jgi:hypothetical protein